MLRSITKMTNVITVHNEKGGVGKSTVALTIAAGIAMQGKSVVFIDADPQDANVTSLLGLPKRPAFYDLIVRDAEWEDSVITLDPEQYSTHGESRGALYIVTSNHETSTIPNHVSNTFIVRSRLQELGHVDTVIIDTSPAPTALNGMIFMASDHIIFTTQCERASVDGLRGTMKRMVRFINDRANAGQGVANVLGIVPTMYQKNTVDHSEHLAEIQRDYGAKVWSPIARRIAWTESSTFKTTIFAHDIDSAAAKEGWRLVDEYNAAMKAVRA
jgi:chromosome partitioning protein